MQKLIEMIEKILDQEYKRIDDNFFLLSSSDDFSKTTQTFSIKWDYVDKIEKESFEQYDDFQKNWFLKLYGFQTENKLKILLKKKKIIIDAGCGLGHKTYWISKLAPESIVIGIDISDAVNIARNRYKGENLFFLKGDISSNFLKQNSVDLMICDQVLMHTKKPDATFKNLSKMINFKGHFFCYVYRKKAIPRELLDDYFRVETSNISEDKMWEFSRQMFSFGKYLEELDVELEIPDIELLNIKKGKYSLQRFIYWNFLKCFYNSNFSDEINISTNFDWYSPQQAKRYSKQEYLELCRNLKIEFFHEEEACYSSKMLKV